jgi:hypothetical protein
MTLAATRPRVFQLGLATRFGVCLIRVTVLRQVHRQSVAYAREAFAPAKERLNALVEKEIPALRATLRQAGAPWTIGEPIAP